MTGAGRRQWRAGNPGSPRRTKAEGGQAAVELALVLPLLAVLLLVLVQVGLVVREQILVVHAAREAAREAAVDPSPGAARDAALASSDLDPARLSIVVQGRGGAGSRVQVTARYGPPTALPLLGAALSQMHLEATATMRVEQ
ncbi:MAG: TadE/TadG family type IV pilus assembly protein [Acidimicrobiales bacterium]